MARLDIFGDGTGRNLYSLTLTGPELFVLHRALRQVGEPKEPRPYIRLHGQQQATLDEIREALERTTDDIPRLREQ